MEVEIRKGWSQDELPKLPAGMYDLVYIDGDHTYEGVKSDIANAAGLVRSGGILCGDDLELQAHECDLAILNTQPNIDQHYDPAVDAYFHPGVTKAVNETFGQVSSWYGFWAMQKMDDGWVPVSLRGMPPHIPGHIPARSLMGLKALLMEEGIL